MPLCTPEAAREYVAGKSVAVVCNAPEILDMDYGHEIDEFDLVLRMNRAFPTKENASAIGYRTDILTGGLIHPLKDVPIIPWIFWFKHTKLGSQHLRDIVTNSRLRHISVLHSPPEWFNSLWKQFGKGPSSGPCAIETLRHLNAGKIHVFGLTCWGKLERFVPEHPSRLTHWWDYPDEFKALGNTTWHDHTNEAIWWGLNTDQLDTMHYEVRR